MQVFDLIENMLLSRPNARGVFLSTVLWDQHMHEQMSDEIENGADPKDFRFYVRGKPVLHDPSLKPGTAEFVTWPEKM